MERKWELVDWTSPKGGYLRLTYQSVPVADFFPFARDADEALIRLRAQLIVDAMNEAEMLGDALSQLVGWVEECGSDHEGRQFVLTEARAALKKFHVVGAN